MPAVAVADSISEISAEIEIRFAGRREGMEKNMVEKAGYEMDFIKSSSMNGRNLFKKFISLAVLTAGVFGAVRLLKNIRPTVVLATGGYVCFPVLAAAVILRIPVYLQEQNSLPGLTTRLFAKRAKVVFSAWDSVQKLLKAKETLNYGNPVRKFNRPEEKKSAKSAEKTIVVFGGSQGASSINNAVDRGMELLKETGLNLIWQTGKRDYEKYKSKYDSLSGIEIYPFIDDIYSFYRKADIAVCRAGAIALSEIFLFGLPAVVVPYPYAADNHQAKNAEEAEKQGAVVVVSEERNTGRVLIEKAIELSKDEERLAYMHQKGLSLSRPDSAFKIGNEIIRRELGEA